MLVSRLDEKNYVEILELINAKSIEEIEINGIEDFPKDGGKYKRSNSHSAPRKEKRENRKKAPNRIKENYNRTQPIIKKNSIRMVRQMSTNKSGEIRGLWWKSFQLSLRCLRL